MITSVTWSGRVTVFLRVCKYRSGEREERGVSVLKGAADIAVHLVSWAEQ